MGLIFLTRSLSSTLLLFEYLAFIKYILPAIYHSGEYIEHKVVPFDHRVGLFLGGGGGGGVC